MTYLGAATVSFSTLDFLYVSLGLAVIAIAVALTIALLNLVKLIKDVRKVSNTVGDISSKLHQIVVTPVSIISSVVERVGPMVEGFIAKKMDEAEEKED